MPAGQIGLGVFLIGVISLIIGIMLLIAGIEEGEAGIETKWGTFIGPPWFIFMIVGIFLMVIGWTIPF